MTITNNLALTLVDQSQAQKEVTVNTALTKIDAVLNIGAFDKDLAAPPGSPAAGDVYIIAASPTGAWAGQAGKIAYYDQSWKFITAKEGMTLWVRDEDRLYSYDGSNWVQSVRGGKKTQWIPGPLMRPAVSGGCAVLTGWATAANQPDVYSLDFDAATIEYAQFPFAMPKSWNEGTVTAQFLWSHAATTTNFGVVWSIQGVSVSDLDSVSAAYGTSVSVTDTGGITNTQYITAETGVITLAGSPAENDVVYFRIAREATNASDTLAIDARLHGIRLFFTTNAYTDE